jgi:hypothetical protein
MGVRQCRGDLRAQVRRAPGREGAFLGKEPGQVAARHELHDEPGLAVLFDELVHPHDVRVGQAGRRRRLAAQQPSRLITVLGLRDVAQPHLLECHGPAALFVGGTPDDTHPARVEQRVQPVSLSDELTRLGHGVHPPFGRLCGGTLAGADSGNRARSSYATGKEVRPDRCG